jgi:hypothetical protein
VDIIIYVKGPDHYCYYIITHFRAQTQQSLGYIVIIMLFTTCTCTFPREHPVNQPESFTIDFVWITRNELCRDALRGRGRFVIPKQ